MQTWLPNLLTRVWGLKDAKKDLENVSTLNRARTRSQVPVPTPNQATLAPLRLIVAPPLASTMKKIKTLMRNR